MMKNKKNARTRMLNYLKTGCDITTSQARSRFGIVNVSARVAELREQGYPIYTNRKNINGVKKNVYRLGAKFPRKARTETARRESLIRHA
jgi:hypothetical protein